MTYTVVTEAGERLYRPHPEEFPDNGYLVFQEEDSRWGWIWQETNEEDEFGPHFTSHAGVLLDAAQNWDDCGDSPTTRFSGMLRGLAVKAHRTYLRDLESADRQENER